MDEIKNLLKGNKRFHDVIAEYSKLHPNDQKKWYYTEKAKYLWQYTSEDERHLGYPCLRKIYRSNPAEHKRSVLETIRTDLRTFKDIEDNVRFVNFSKLPDKMDTKSLMTALNYVRDEYRKLQKEILYNDQPKATRKTKAS